MATIGGPNTEKGNLVFGYDTGYGVADKDTSTRFYPGKPTANIVPDAYTMSGWGNYSAGNDGTFITEFGTTGYKVRNKNTWNGIAKGITLPSTGTYTISAWFRIWGKSSGNNGINVYTNGGGIGDTAQGGDDTRIGEWQRISMTRTYTTTSITFFIISWGGTSGTDWSSWDVTMPQIEKQSTQSPFLIGTRSSTQSLIDLKRTTGIDVSNASFDSTGQPDLDGTSDYFHTTTSCGITGDITLEAVFNEESATSPHTTVICTDTDHQKGVKLMSYKNSNRYGLWLGFGTSSYVAMVNGTLNNDTVYHLVGTWERVSGTVKIYLNGELTGTINTGQTSAVVLNTGKITVGVDYHGLSSSYGLNGQVYVGKVYNRVITSEEIKQNYNAYKNRFDI